MVLFWGEVRLKMFKYYIININYININYYKHLGSDRSPQSCLYFQDLREF